jgi:4-diphosphocytidyl-2-C-methyl-D-erythritol kinase
MPVERSLILRPPAKINLTLHVGPARADGYHDVRTLLQSIALSDAVIVTARKGPFALAARGPGVPEDRTNLVWKAAEVLWRAIGRTGDPRDVHIKLDKQIPMEAGLGGGSADAAAALSALNVVWEGRRSRRDLMNLARLIGADVPFFLHGGTALGVGRGDELYPVDDITRLGVVVIKPSFGVATADAYQWLDLDRASEAAVGRGPAAANEVDVGWPSGPLRLENDLQAPVARRHSDIGAMMDALRKAGSIGAGMTGSGSAVFGLFSEMAAKAAVRQLHRPEWLVLLTRTLGRSEAVRRMGV